MDQGQSFSPDYSYESALIASPANWLKGTDRDVDIFSVPHIGLAALVANGQAIRIDVLPLIEYMSGRIGRCPIPVVFNLKNESLHGL